MSEPDQQALLVRLTADIASAYVGANSLAAGELPALIRIIHGGLVGEPPEAQAEPQRPAVPIRKSVAPDYLVCLEDGLRFSSLKRHLRSHGLSPEAYRAKWGLPRDYPIVAPAYSAVRSRLAKETGLGQIGRRGVEPAKSAPRARPTKA